MKMMRKIIMAASVVALAAGLAACSGSPKPSVAACTKAYPAWFAASAANAGGSNKPAPTPAACKGLSDAQVARIAEKYLASLSN